jgi:hypothetical protein
MRLHYLAVLAFSAQMFVVPALAQETPLELVNEFYENFQQAEAKYSSPHDVDFRIGKVGTTEDGLNLVAYNEAPRHANGMPADTIWTMVCALHDSWTVLDGLLGQTHAVRIVGVRKTASRMVEFNCELL